MPDDLAAGSNAAPVAAPAASAAPAPVADVGSGGMPDAGGSSAGYAAPEVGGQPAAAGHAPDLSAQITHLREQLEAQTRDFGSFRDRYAEVDPDEYRSLIQRTKQEADPFAEDHPQRGEILERVRMVDVARKIIARIPQERQSDEARALMADMGLTQEDFRLHGDWARRQARDERLRQENPAKYFEQIQKKAEDNAYNRVMRELKAKEWIQDPSRASIRDHAPAIARFYDQSIPMAERTESIAAVLAENAALKAKLAGEARDGAMADAQAAARGSTVPAGRTTDGERRKAIDAPTYVREVLKLTPASPQYTTKLLETNDKIRAGQL
jgi:hypothetical protein